MSKIVMTEPEGELTIRTFAMPADTNNNGDIFGGWLVSQMDLAGLSIAAQCAKSRAVTVSIDKMEFMQPVHVGDFVCCYAKLIHIGRTSMRVKIQVWAVDCQAQRSERRHVTEGIFTYVAIDLEGKPVLVQS